MNRPRIIIHVPPELLGERRRLFERFREALVCRAARLFPDAETVCRRGPVADIAVTGLAEEDADRAEIIQAEAAAALEDLLQSDDSWWDEAERRRAAEGGPDGWRDDAPEEPRSPDEPGPAIEPRRPVEPDRTDADEAAEIAPGAPADRSADAPAASGRAASGGRSRPEAPPPVLTAQQEPAGQEPAAEPAGGRQPADFPPAGSVLRRVGRAWLALFPAWGLSVRLEERADGLAGAVTRLLPGAAPSPAAWAKLTGGKGRAVTWDKAPPGVLAALRAMVKGER